MNAVRAHLPRCHGFRLLKHGPSIEAINKTLQEKPRFHPLRQISGQGLPDVIQTTNKATRNDHL